MLIDIHIPTDQGAEALHAALESARDARLDGVVLTWTDAPRPDEVPRVGDLAIFHAAEITTDKGVLIAIPPALDGDLQESLWSLKDQSFDAMVTWCRERNWALVLGQPFADGALLASNSQGPVAQVDAVEVTHGDEPLLVRDLAIEAALGEKRGIAASGGGDPRRIGRFSTLLLPNRSGQAGIVQAICQGAIWVVETGERKVPVQGNDGSARKRGRRRRRRKPSKGNQSAR